MAALWALTATELIAAYEARATSPVEVMAAVLDRVERVNPSINAFREIDAATAMVTARQSETRWRNGAPMGRLDGVPVSVKDLTLTKGMATLRGSKTISSETAWNIDAPSVANLRAEGAIIFGKTTTSEFGNKIVTESPLTGVTRNPWNLTRTSGGSSGGAGAATAAGLGPLALGSDGGGSIRNPANWCGVFGFKPSFRRVADPSPAFGGLTVIGPLTRSVEDAVLMLAVMADRADVADCQASAWQGSEIADVVDLGVRGLRIAYSPDLGLAEVEPSIAGCIAAAVATLDELGAHVEQVPVPPLLTYMESRMHSVQWIVNLAAIVSQIDPDKRCLMDADTLALAEIGSRIPSSAYHAALSARERLAQAMHVFLSDYDLLVCPTFHVGAPTVPGVPENLREAPRFTSWVNQTMQPAASIPCGFDHDGLPVGLQIVGRRMNDAIVLRVARAYERARGSFPMPTLS